MSEEAARLKAKVAMEKLEDKLDAFFDRLFKNLDPKDAAIYGGIAYLGYRAFESWGGALYGMVALKLATTEGGTPPVAQIAGLAALGHIGLNYMTPSIEGALEKVGVIVPKKDWLYYYSRDQGIFDLAFRELRNEGLLVGTDYTRARHEYLRTTVEGRPFSEYVKWLEDNELTIILERGAELRAGFPESIAYEG